MAAAAFPSGAKAAVLASGENFPDSLAASYLGGQVHGPVLLTQHASLPAATAAELKALHVSTVYVVGGTGAVSATVVSSVAALTAPGGGHVSVTRIAGADRYATAAAVATRFASRYVGTVGGERAALLASGAAFPDALAGGPVAAGAHLPLLLTNPTSLSAQVLPALRTLGVTRVVVLGGPGAVSDGVATALGKAGLHTTRLGGADRGATATAIADWETNTLGWAPGSIAVARGDNAGKGVDALSLGVLAGQVKEPVLLAASPTSLGAALSAWLTAHTGITSGTIAGGPGAIADTVVTIIRNILSGVGTGGTGAGSGGGGNTGGGGGTGGGGVANDLAVTTSSLHDGTAGTRYLETLAATGGTAPYIWAASGLPDGLSLDPDGTLSGVPTGTGTSSVRVTVTDANAVTASATLSLAVPDTLPAQCIAQSCQILTPDGQTVQVPGTQVVSVTRDPSTGKVTTVVITGQAPAPDQVAVFSSSDPLPSGLIAVVNTITDNGDGTTTLAVTPATLADAYAEGTVQIVPPTANSTTLSVPNTSTFQTGSSTSTLGNAGDRVPEWAVRTDTVQRGLAAIPASTQTTESLQGVTAGLSCDANVSAQATALKITPSFTPTLTALWHHPLIGGGGVYVGAGGLQLFQADVDGTVTIETGVSISGAANCELSFSGLTTAVPAGPLGAVVFDLDPSLKLEVSGKISAETSVTLTCGAEYRWSEGQESRVQYCHTSNTPLHLEAASGVEAKATAELGASITLDDTLGITGTVSDYVHASYAPLSHPIAKLEAGADWTLEACLACFWKGSPAKVTVASGEFFHETLATYDTDNPPPAPALQVLDTNVPSATEGLPYTFTFTTSGGAQPITWALSEGTLPAGLSLSTAGTISGTPQVAGDTQFTLTVKDESGDQLVGNIAFTVQPPPPPDPIAPPVGTVWPGTATPSKAVTPLGIAIDKTGNYYIADGNNNVIRKISAGDGRTETVAGNGGGGSTPDGHAALDTQIPYPQSVVIDPKGNIYFGADLAGGASVRKVDAESGLVSTVVGCSSGYCETTSGSPASSFLLRGVSALATDAAGNIYIADRKTVLQYDPTTGLITTLAGGGNASLSLDGGPAQEVSIAPMGLAVDSQGALYISSGLNRVVYRLARGSNSLTRFAGDGSLGAASGDGGPATAASLGNPSNLAFDPRGNLIIGDTDSQVLRKVDFDSGAISTVPGVAFTWGLAVDGSGAILVGEYNRLYRIDPVAGLAAVVAGNGTESYSGDGGPASDAQLAWPQRVSVDSVGNVYVADTENAAIRRIDATTGTITTVTSDKRPVEGTPLDVTLGLVDDLAIDKSGDLFIALPTMVLELNVDSNTITRVAGADAARNLHQDYSDGQPATSVDLQVSSIAVDSAGNLYIANQGDAVYRVDAATGIITTFAGNGTAGYSGDGGPAKEAELSRALDLALDPANNLYIADNFVVRRVDSTTGIISTVAGDGNPGVSGDGGPATSADLEPTSIAVDGDGNLYIGSYDPAIVRRVAVDSGTISTIAGSIPNGYSGDGIATGESIMPDALAVLSVGSVLIADGRDQVLAVVDEPAGTISKLAGLG